MAPMVKNPLANAGDTRNTDSWVRKIPWSRNWQPIPVFLPGKSHGQRSLVGYSPWSHKSRTWLSMCALIWNREFCPLYFCYIMLLSMYIFVFYIDTWSFRTRAIKCSNHKAHLHFFDSMITKYLHMLGSLSL